MEKFDNFTIEQLEKIIAEKRAEEIRKANEHLIEVYKRIDKNKRNNDAGNRDIAVISYIVSKGGKFSDVDASEIEPEKVAEMVKALGFHVPATLGGYAQGLLQFLRACGHLNISCKVILTENKSK